MRNYDYDREVREARSAGIRALNSMRRAERLLDSARGWGVADILGGGFITNLVKHAKLEDARAAIDEARADLDRFSEELRDVRAPEIDIDGFLTFADFFFDGFLADFMVQRRINDAREQLRLACDRVEDVLRQLPER